MILPVVIRLSQRLSEILRVKNLSTAGPCANLRFKKKDKETLLILPIIICLSQRLSNSGVAKSLDGNFYNFPYKEFINGEAVRKFEISRRNKRKPG